MRLLSTPWSLSILQMPHPNAALHISPRLSPRPPVLPKLSQPGVPFEWRPVLHAARQGAPLPPLLPRQVQHPLLRRCVRPLVNLVSTYTLISRIVGTNAPNWTSQPNTPTMHHLPTKQTGAPSSKSLVAFLVLNLLPFAWIFFSLGLGRKFYGDMTGSVGKDARQEGGIDRSLSFEDVAGE